MKIETALYRENRHPDPPPHSAWERELIFDLAFEIVQQFSELHTEYVLVICAKYARDENVPANVESVDKPRLADLVWVSNLFIISDIHG